MNLFRLFLPIAALVLAPFSLRAQDAHGHDHSDTPEWADLFGDASLAVVWQSAAASAERTTAALGRDELEGIADWAETIHLAAHALMDQVEEGDPGRKRRLHAALAQAAEIADEVLDGAQHGELDRTERAFRRLNSAVMLARMRLPKSVTEAPAAEPRFAKAGEHAH